MILTRQYVKISNSMEVIVKKMMEENIHGINEIDGMPVGKYHDLSIFQ